MKLPGENLMISTDYGMNAETAAGFYDDRYRETIIGFGAVGLGDCPIGSDVVPGLIEACRVNGLERGSNEDTNYRTLVGAVSTDYAQWLRLNYSLEIQIRTSDGSRPRLFCENLKP